MEPAHRGGKRPTNVCLSVSHLYLHLAILCTFFGIYIIVHLKPGQNQMTSSLLGMDSLAYITRPRGLVSTGPGRKYSGQP